MLLKIILVDALKRMPLKIVMCLLLISPVGLTKELQIVGPLLPPYLYEDEGKVVGIDAEIIKSVFGEMEVDYQIQICPLARCLLLLEAGDADMLLGVPKSNKNKGFAIYPQSYSRNAEYVMMVNKKIKEEYAATSLEYIRDHNLLVGVLRGEVYHQRFWDLYPPEHIKENTLSQSVKSLNLNEKPHYRYNRTLNEYLDISHEIESNLKKLDLNRLDVVPVEKTVGQYTVSKLGLNNISHYDFVIFFKTIYNVFSKHSTFQTEKYQNVEALSNAYSKLLQVYKQVPDFQAIYNWPWVESSKYPSKPMSVSGSRVGPVINIGFLAALTGPDSAWGKPGITGNQLYIDTINAEGGLLVAGVRYPLKMHVYDDQSISKFAKKGAKYLVEKYQVKFISGIGGASADAIQSYLTQHKVIYASLLASDIKPGRPYLLAGGDVTPRIDMLRPWYHRNKNPELKKWAVLSQNDPAGRVCQAWEVGAAVAEGWDVVYDQHFDINTENFAPIVSQVLATKPDVVSLNLSWPAFVSDIVEQLYLQGFQGEISANYMDVEANLKRVPLAFHEGAVDSFPLFNDPFWGGSSKQEDFYQRWLTKYGTGAPEDVKRQITGIDWDHSIMLQIWAFGAQLASSFDPDLIIKSLREQKQFPTLLGPARMSGMEMWGINNMVSPPIPITETRNGVKRIQTIKKFDEWFDENKANIIKVVKDKGLYWGATP